MDWLELSGLYPRDNDLPARAAAIQALLRVLDGTQYDILGHPFSCERSGSGEYVALSKRRPSVRTHMCRVVVDDAVALLFSEGHFPKVAVDDETSREALADLIKSVSLNETMIEAATVGSVGSVAIRLRVLKNRVFLDVMRTPFLTPAWQPDAPDTLASVTEKYKVSAADLIAQGYSVKPTDGMHWFQRVWTDQDETWFLPWPVRDDDAVPQIDKARSVAHGLGFVPIVWVRNLANCAGPDGTCTFATAIDTVIEADYLLSQAGRALKYAADPKLVIKSGASDVSDIGGAANVLRIDTDGNAELLEINGTAAAATLEHTRELRGIVLELLHGNRAHPDKLSAASSGRALELMNQGLIWLADRMRSCYGEKALTALLRMVCAASARISGGIETAPGKMLAGINPAGLTLKWPAWYAPSHEDKLSVANALTAALNARLISQETAVEAIAPVYDVDDVQAEMAAIEADDAARIKRMADEAAAVNVSETGPA